LYLVHTQFILVFFFFQAEDGIRDFHVTGVQTCALPILKRKPACVSAFGTGFLPAEGGEGVGVRFRGRVWHRIELLVVGRFCSAARPKSTILRNRGISFAAFHYF